MKRNGKLKAKTSNQIVSYGSRISRQRGASLFIETGVGNARLGLAGGLGFLGTEITLTAWLVLLKFVVFK